MSVVVVIVSVIAFLLLLLSVCLPPIEEGRLVVFLFLAARKVG